MEKEQIVKTYEYADKVYNDLISKSEAAEILYEEFPEIKTATHKTNVDNYCSMLNGENYKWALNVDMTVYFLNRINEKYGVEKLKIALKSVYENIIHQYRWNMAKSYKMREECQKIADENNINMDFSDRIFDGVFILKPLKKDKVDKCWFVGAYFGDKDMVPEFLEKGIWLNGYEDKYIDKVKEIQVGDKIAIKRACTQKLNLPFDIKNGTASAMKIIVTGTVTKNYGDGRNLKVEWNKPFDIPKMWYFFTSRITVWEVTRRSEDWMYGALLDFTFADEKQAYQKFLDFPYWKEKYGLYGEEEETEETENIEETVNTYNKQNFLTDVFMTEENYNKLVALLKFKRNIILQGAPGVGKTYAAKRLAYSLIGAEDNSKIAMVQFHQNYSYEDFVMGYRPTENGFELRNGVFYEFCQKARNDLEHNYYFIIDEINRGNLSAIFGELLMLIESDYRNKPVTLVYKKDEQFSVPPNVYIIGMMNTADRSIAMIDYALRRRFSFFTMNPGFDSDGFKRMQSDIDNSVYNDLIAEIKSLNSEIAQDDSLGEGFCIGHSYFVYDNNCRTDVEAWLKNVVEYDILPMLNEYWFDEKTKADNWKNKLMGVFDK